MFLKIVTLLIFTIFIQSFVYSFEPNDDFEQLDTEIQNQIVYVTTEAAEENPNILYQQSLTGAILKKHVQNFDEYYNNEFLSLQETIDTELQQNTPPNSIKEQCLNFEKTQIPIHRTNGTKRATNISQNIDNGMKPIMSDTEQLLFETKLDEQVKTVLELCLKLYPKFDQAEDRLNCFATYGQALNFAQKAKGQQILASVFNIQYEMVIIANQTTIWLQDMYNYNEYEYNDMKLDVEKCGTAP